MYLCIRKPSQPTNTIMNMKKTIFLAALLCYGVLWAQYSPSTPRRDCHISVHGSFESSCLYEDKQVLSDEYPNMIVAWQPATT